MKKIEDEKNLDKKKILLRLDLNIPIKNGIITDSTRIDKILPTLKYLLNYDCKIIIILFPRMKFLTTKNHIRLEVLLLIPVVQI